MPELLARSSLWKTVNNLPLDGTLGFPTITSYAQRGDKRRVNRAVNNLTEGMSMDSPTNKFYPFDIADGAFKADVAPERLLSRGSKEDLSSDSEVDKLASSLLLGENRLSPVVVKRDGSFNKSQISKIQAAVKMKLDKIPVVLGE